MNTTQIVDLIFDLHRDFINPKVIARRQVVRLVDRLLTKAAPEILLNRRIENKENAADAQNSAAKGTPARPLLEQAAPIDVAAERKNLALQLNAAGANKATDKSMQDAGPLLEQAPESERSEAFSMPVSEGDPNSARQGFNQVQNLRMSGKVAEGKTGSGLLMSLGKDSASDVLDNLEINIDGEDAAQPDVPAADDLQISEIRMN